MLFKTKDNVRVGMVCGIVDGRKRKEIAKVSLKREASCLSLRLVPSFSRLSEWRVDGLTLLKLHHTALDGR